MKILKSYFAENPEWSFTTKMEVANKIGMTVGQVSKWNWDMRKKMGMDTDRKRKKLNAPENNIKDNNT